MTLRSRFSMLISILLIGMGTLSCNSGATTETQENTSATTSSEDLSGRFLDKDAFAAGIKKSGSVLVDVRMPQEFEQGHIDGAINIDFFGPEFKYNLLELKKNKAYYLYCKNETRSKMSLTFMNNNGFKDVYVLKGGFEKWNVAHTE